jgi:hypothetical protein
MVSSSGDVDESNVCSSNTLLHKNAVCNSCHASFYRLIAVLQICVAHRSLQNAKEHFTKPACRVTRHCHRVAAATLFVSLKSSVASDTVVHQLQPLRGSTASENAGLLQEITQNSVHLSFRVQCIITCTVTQPLESVQELCAAT